MRGLRHLVALIKTVGGKNCYWLRYIYLFSYFYLTIIEIRNYIFHYSMFTLNVYNLTASNCIKLKCSWRNLVETMHCYFTTHPLTLLTFTWAMLDVHQMYSNVQFIPGDKPQVFKMSSYPKIILTFASKAEGRVLSVILRACQLSWKEVVGDAESEFLCSANESVSRVTLSSCLIHTLFHIFSISCLELL